MTGITTNPIAGSIAPLIPLLPLPPAPQQHPGPTNRKVLINITVVKPQT